MRRRANAGPQPGTRPLFGLAPGGVWPAGVSPRRWCALTAPFHPCPARAGRYVSVPLSVGSPRLGVTQRPALWSSDFPRSAIGEPRTLGPLHLHSTTCSASPRQPAALSSPEHVSLPGAGATRLGCDRLWLPRRPSAVDAGYAGRDSHSGHGTDAGGDVRPLSSARDMNAGPRTPRAD